MRRLLSLDPLLHTLDTAPAERPAGGAEARAGGVERRAAEEEGAPDACEGCRQVSPAEPAAALEPQLPAPPCMSGPLLVQAPRCPHVGSSPSRVLGTAAAGPPGPGTTGRRAPRRRAAEVPIPGSCGDTHKLPPGSPVSPPCEHGLLGTHGRSQKPVRLVPVEAGPALPRVGKQCRNAPGCTHREALVLERPGLDLGCQGQRAVSGSSRRRAAPPETRDADEKGHLTPGL